MAAVIRSVFIELDAPLVGTAYADPTLDALYDVYKASRSVYFVVQNDGKIIGGGGIGPLENGPAATCELQKMYFLPQARGLGLGAQIMAKCLAAAKDFGFSQCYLETLPNMEAAQKLYLRYGFKYLDAPMGNTGHSSCPVWMIKELV